MTHETVVKNLQDAANLCRALWSDESGMDMEELAARPVWLALIETMASAADLLDQRDRAEDDLKAAQAWIRVANQFAWAHERTCPRHDADEPCNCGLEMQARRLAPDTPEK